LVHEKRKCWIAL